MISGAQYQPPFHYTLLSHSLFYRYKCKGISWQETFRASWADIGKSAIIVSAARSLTCRDDLDSKWRLLLAENELSCVSLLS